MKTRDTAAASPSDSLYSLSSVRPRRPSPAGKHFPRKSNQTLDLSFKSEQGISIVRDNFKDIILSIFKKCILSYLVSINKMF